jgi:vomeronasal 2 receptor
MQFNNPVADQEILDEMSNIEPEYDIFNSWNFPEGLGLKVGKFSPNWPCDQQLSLSENIMEWVTGIIEVGWL